MIKHVKYEHIDKQKWDDCISQSFNGMIYAYSWYLDIVCEKWEALIEDDYESVFPLTVGKKYGFNYLYQPFFAQQLGVFSKNEPDSDIVERFLSEIPTKYQFVEINLNTNNKVSPTNKIEQSQIIKTNLTLELNLIETYDDHFKRFSDNAKRNIKRANKNNLKIVEKIEPKEIIKLFRENKGRELADLKDRQYAVLDQLIRLCVFKGKGQVWGVCTKENNLCAGAFFVDSNDKTIFLFSGANSEAKSNGAMSFLMDRFIKENSGKNLILDFEGSKDPGLSRFYRSFGSKESVYLQIRKNNLPWYVKWLKN